MTKGMSNEQQALLRVLHGQGHLNGEIAGVLGVSNSTVTKWMQRLNLTRNTQHQRKVARIQRIAERMRQSPHRQVVRAPAPIRCVDDKLLERLEAGRR